jgi:hypothetical protein
VINNFNEFDVSNWVRQKGRVLSAHSMSPNGAVRGTRKGRARHVLNIWESYVLQQ